MLETEFVMTAARHECLAWLWNRRWQIGFAASLVAGCVFRLIWLSDMEYKADESWTFDRVAAFLHSGEAPLIGMPSSAGIPNAGLSVWLFLGLGYGANALSPLTLARAVQVVNVAALLLLAVFSLRVVERRERESWLWATALVAVNPLAVLFSRKIWPPELFPIFTIVFLTAWWKRSTLAGAFFWGLIGALLGQIQLGGFLFAFSFALVTLIVGRREVNWPAWLAGSAIGALPMVPWLVALTHHVSATGAAPWRPNLGFLEFFLYWPGFATGLDLPYALGDDFAPFLASPSIGDAPTYLASCLFAVVAATWTALIATSIFRFFRSRSSDENSVPGVTSTPALIASMAVYGATFVAVGGKVQLHYLIIAFPLPTLSLLWLATARAAKPPRPALAVLAATTAILTMLFLAYIHEAGYIRGDYGAPYRTIAPPPK